MNFLKSTFSRLLQNKHTSGAALVYGACEVASGLAAIWAPHYQAQVDATGKLIQKAALGYGLMMAGDSRPQDPPPLSKGQQIASDTYHAPTP